MNVKYGKQLKISTRQDHFQIMCEYSFLLIPILVTVILGGLLIFPVQFALGETDGIELYVYVDKLPDWAPYATNVMYESTKYWEEQIPELNFYLVDDPQLADFRVQWVKDFGVEHIGYAYGSKFIEVGLGDSNCLDQWNPFSANYVSTIMIHEIGHILGYGHTDDPNDVMYPIALNHEYGLVEYEMSFAESYGRYIPMCSSKQATSFDFHVSTDDPKYGFDVYFVPSSDSFDQFADGQPFEYYADDSCFGEGYLQYGSTCEGVAGDGGLLIVTDDVQSNSLTTIIVQIQELSKAQTHEESQSFSMELEDVDSTDIIDSYNLFVDPQKRYTIKYPSTWIVNDSVFESHQVGFYNKQDWTAAITVLQFEGSYTGYSNDDIVDAIIEFERDYCDSLTYSDSGQICYDFEVYVDDVVLLESGQYVYLVGYTSTRQYDDLLSSGEHSTVTVLTELHDGDSIWNVVVESDQSIFELYSVPLMTSLDSFKLTSTSAHQTGHTERIPVPKESDLGFEIPTPFMEIGNVAVDQDVYVISSRHVTTYAKISGTVEEVNKGDKIAITYTYPDGTTHGNLVYPTKDGYFETLLSLDKDSPHGTYEAFASLRGKIVGIVTFEVTDKQPGQVLPPTVAKELDNEENDHGKTPTVIHEDVDDVVNDDNNANASSPVIDTPSISTTEPKDAKTSSIPEWIKISAGWWAQDSLDDDAFLQSIRYLVNEGIIQIPTTEAKGDQITNKMPTWVKINAGWWAQGLIDDDVFVQSIQFLIKNGIIVTVESE